MAGLPGTGKTTLARRLALALPAPHLDKDSVRAALFGAWVDYSPEQNDFCCDVLHRAVSWLAGRGATPYVVLDGRTYARRSHVAALLEGLRPFRVRTRFLLCTCRPEVARERLRAEQGEHLARDRVPGLYDRMAASVEPLGVEHHVVDKTEGVDAGAWEACLRYARG